MSELSVIFGVLLSLLTCAAISFFSLKVFSIKAASKPPRKDADVFAEFGLPSSAAARHELLKNDPNGVVFEKIKAAARLKVDQPMEFFVARLQRRAGIVDEESVEEWRKGVLLNLLFSVAATFLFGAIKGMIAAAIAAPFFFLVSISVSVIRLHHAGNAREKIVNTSLRSIVWELRSLLMGANDVVTCLNALAKGPGRLINPDDPVREVLVQAVEEMQEGVPIDVALRDAARQLEMKNFSALCSYLIMVHSGSPEWKQQFDELIACLDDYDLLAAEQKRREEKRKLF